jgi:hypothetical protein
MSFCGDLKGFQWWCYREGRVCECGVLEQQEKAFSTKDVSLDHWFGLGLGLVPAFTFSGTQR